jgi:excisionase family DNA binding protein
MGQLPDLLTTREAARELRVDEETIRVWIRDGRLLAITLPSGTYRIRRQVIEDILATGSPAGAA